MIVDALPLSVHMFMAILCDLMDLNKQFALFSHMSHIRKPCLCKLWLLFLLSAGLQVVPMLYCLLLVRCMHAQMFTACLGLVKD